MNTIFTITSFFIPLVLLATVGFRFGIVDLRYLIVAASRAQQCIRF